MSLQPPPVLQIALSEPQSKSQARRNARWAIVAAFCSLIVTIIAVKAVTIGIERLENMEKRGAGLLLCSGNRVLLLLRRSSHNDNTWGLPGGNVDATDASLEATAVREAGEEMGTVPPFTLRGSVLTRRGKFNSKHYTVFLADVAPDVAATYVPVLNKEHREWRWFAAGDAARLPNLHPVTAALFSPALRPQVESIVPLLAAALSGTGAVASPGAPVDGLAEAKPITILPATSGDVGSAPASASVSAVEAGSTPATKRGAGLVLVSEDTVLLLRRQSKHHDGAWALPGGNVEGGEEGGADTALREAKEEMGTVPTLDILGQVSFRWGKKGDKAFTAVVCRVDPATRAAYVPTLNKEHSEFQWLALNNAALLEDLHPVARETLAGASSAEVKRLLGLGPTAPR